MPRILVNAGSPGEGWLGAALALVEEAVSRGLEVVVLAEPGFSERLGRALRRREVVFLRPLPGRPEETALSLIVKYGPAMLVHVARPGPSLDGCSYAAGCRPARGMFPSHYLEVIARMKGIPTLGVYRGAPEMGSYNDPAQLYGERRCPPSPGASTMFSVEASSPERVRGYFSRLVESYA